MTKTLGEPAILFSLVCLLCNIRSPALFSCSCLLLLLALRHGGIRIGAREITDYYSAMRALGFNKRLDWLLALRFFLIG